MRQQIVSATEARKNFFQILVAAEKGIETVIVKKDSNKKFKIIYIQNEAKVDIEKLLDEIADIGLHAGTPEEIKEVLNAMHDIKV